MDYNQEALKVHEQYKGKLRVECPAPLDTRDDLSVAYTPGVAEPCRKIAANEEEVYRYTTKGHMVAVVTDGTAVLGKPADELEAFKMLSTLSGCRHQVYTGLTVLRGEERHTVSEETTVAFRELSEEEISCYIQTGEPMDKGGAYGFQAFGALLI